MDRALEDFMVDICRDRNDKASDSADSAFFELDHSITENGHTLATPSLSGGLDSEVDAKVKVLQDFVSESLPESRHQVVTSAGSTLVLSVHHPNAWMRAAAISQLGKTLGGAGKVRLLAHFLCVSGVICVLGGGYL